MKRRLIGFVFGFGLLLLLCAVPAWAISNPGSVSIGDAAVFGDILETGDQLYFCRYDVAYSSEPSEDAEDTFQMAIYNSDGSFTGYFQPLHYYQHNIITIYLTSSQALTWGVDYKIRITGHPAIFSPLIEGTNMKTVTLSGGDWHDFKDMAEFLISQAKILEDDWGFALLTSTDKLNTTGSVYFTEAIPGLYNMLPEIFQYTASYPSVGNMGWTNATAGNFTERKGAILKGALEKIADWLGTTPNWIGLWIIGMFLSLVAAPVFAATRQPTVGLLVASLAIPLGVAVGVLDLAIYELVFIMIGILFAILFIQSRFG